MFRRIRDHADFLREVLRSPSRIGAVAPSSERLAEVITDDIGLESASMVLELGAGTGVFTSEIERRSPQAADLLAVEANPRMAQRLRRRLDRVEILQIDVARLREVLSRRDIAERSADCIVSGLPWASFDGATQSELLAALITELHPDGTFATFTYVHSPWLPAGREFADRLREEFDRVETSPVVWRNLPPAFVYRCSNPTASGPQSV
ncbi:MAG: class I SAM-dependent methyltransferase [Bradymonadaceae bacterium]